MSVGLPRRLGYSVADGATLIGPGGSSGTFTPARSPRGDYVLFAGHIDNRAEMIRSLPGNFDTNCDDATLYGLCHAEFGDACDLKLVGQYAVILWSSEANSIKLIRSPILAPPLHIWQGPDSIIIASTPRAIFTTGEVRQELDEQKIADSLFLNYAEDERSWFKDITRLPVGTRAVITRDGMTSAGYYDPFAGGPVRLGRDEDYVEAANALFLEGTQAALQGFSQPAISLSGGLDSQAVAAFTLKALPSESSVHSFTSVPEPGWDGLEQRGRFGNERAHVEAFAAMYPRLKPTFVDAAGLSFDHKLDTMFLMASVAPRNAMNLHWIHEAHAQAKAAGCDVLLTGAVGNMTFSFNGEGAFPTWLRSGKWGTALRELWAGRGAHASWAHAFAANIVRPFLPRSLALALVQLRYGARADVFETWCPLNPEWAAEMRLAERAREMGHDPNYLPVRSTRDLRMSMFESIGNEAGDIMLGIDLISGIQTRDPTAYRPLLEFCFNIPDEQYIRRGQRRWLAKRMLKDKLPNKVVYERRRGRQAADWHLRLTRQREQLREEIDVLSEDPKMAAMLNLPRLRKVLDDWPSETPLNPRDPASYFHLALSRGLTTARFIRYVSGSNR
ncbi:MAG: asparagine synthetase B family protein [Pseudomonadota bacterium]